MIRKAFLTLTMFLLLISATSILQSQVNNPVLQSQNQAQTIPAQSDGAKRCHNFVKNGEKANCTCWGNANPGDKKYPNCKTQGEDPKCINHCKKDMCDCKSPCQS